jgi:uncharacterized protein YigE (DUF2233 family)
MLQFMTGSVRGAEREVVKYGGGLYHIFRVPQAEAKQLDLLWLGGDGKPLSSFDGLRAHLAAQKKRIVFAANAGIYARGPTPCGLTISAHKELVPLNLSPGEGNFFMKPNGVFYLDDQKGAGVMEAAEFGASGLRPRIATQSGPLLLRRGVIHPAFRQGSPNLRQRSGVGVRSKDGEIVFVMTDREGRPEGRVTFHQLASFFIHLGCADALYLDGDLSDMLVNPQPDETFPANTFAAMFVIAR